MKDYYQDAVKRIESVVDGFRENRFRVTVGNDDFDRENHVYDISAIMGIISNYIAEAYRNAENQKGEKQYGNR